MKTTISVLMLYARSTIYKILAVLVVTGLVEAGLFYFAMDSSLPLDAVFASSHIPLACGVGFLLCMWVLTLRPFQKADYTLRRMQVKPKMLFVTHAIYSAVCLVIFWSFQLTLLLALFHWFGTTADEAVFGPQSIMLACYRDDFLHSLLPLADWPRYLRNGALALMLGGAAAMPLARRGSRGSLVLLVVFSLAMLWIFPAGITARTWDFVLTIAALMIFGSMVVFSQPEKEHQVPEYIPNLNDSSEEVVQHEE